MSQLFHKHQKFLKFIWKIKLKKKFTILGCGSSIGSPWITNYWGNLDKTNKKILEQDVVLIYNIMIINFIRYIS